MDTTKDKYAARARHLLEQGADREKLLRIASTFPIREDIASELGATFDGRMSDFDLALYVVTAASGTAWNVWIKVQENLLEQCRRDLAWLDQMP